MKQQALRIQRDRRRLGRFVAFAEIEADLTPVLLVEQNPARPRTSSPKSRVVTDPKAPEGTEPPSIARASAEPVHYR